ncbi:DEAD/DEAH box helicase [Bacillus sp. 22475]|uniref:DEAD/DEAH box helicase n=1 Tax=Bacillus sp. 22475 TaxID=3453925 RepID=UPI003F85FEB1
MYDKYAQELLSKVPDLDEFDSASYRRALTKGYLFITQLKLGVKEELLHQDLLEVRDMLRKLADTMESIAVFDKINGLEVSEEVESACAFVAAEALSLLNSLLSLLDDKEEEELRDHFKHYKNYIALESALLYMIGGFDINAKSTLEVLKFQDKIDIRGLTYLDIGQSSTLLLQILRTFINGELDKGLVFPITAPKIEFSEKYDELMEKIRITFYIKLIESVNYYISWLKGTDQNGLFQCMQILEKVRKASSVEHDRRNTEYSDVYHFSSILAVAIQKTRFRSLLHATPFPNGANERYREEFQRYLISRAKGTIHKRGRPFLWPSAISYVKQCLPGPSKDCVVTMPTGSGKSFVAEMAMVQALARGWVLYLAPTNALVHQIRRDLKEALIEFNDITIRSFVGGEEYTTLSEEEIGFEEKFVAVMTPEKCALALRLYPEKFENCTLCIFDECHLINDRKRGTNADILLTRLIELAKDIKFLLMSAMISNGEELCDWLKHVHDSNAVCEPIRWRPTRTMRSMLALDRNDLLEKYPEYQKRANKLTGNRKNLYFENDMLLISGLSGPWTLDGDNDYKVSQIPTSFKIKVSKNEKLPDIESWKNTASRILAEKIANSELPVINFILSSKHHAFSSAGKVQGSIEGAVGNLEELPELVKCFLTIANKELGLDTVLWDYLSRGIAVHSSAMLQVEQAASEYMFSNGKARLMFATGTLAQGLNLPAVAVVIAGMKMGDPRETDNIQGVNNDRAKSMILNAFGRAGRPGFSNQGIAVLVPDDPLAVKLDRKSFYTLRGFDLMKEPDASLEVHSPIEGFIDYILSSEYDVGYASNEDLILTSLLAELDDQNSISGTLGKTFGVFQKKEAVTEESLEIARGRIIKIKEDFLDNSETPEWLNLATMKAGVDLFRSLEMWKAYEKRGFVKSDEVSSLNIMDWLNVFFEVMSYMHPNKIKFSPDETIKTETVLTKIRDYVTTKQILLEDTFEITAEWEELWEELKKLVCLYMEGAEYKKIAELLLAKEITSQNRSSGSNPIPTVFKFIKEVIEPIAIDAGCFLALNELGVFQNEEIPESLQALPLAIRNGCNSLGALSWFRFGIRQRKCAHVLEETFPVPEDTINDSNRASWVRKSRMEFLNGPKQEDSFLECIRMVILQDSLNTN